MGEEAEKLNKRLAKLLSTKRKISYSDAISFIRRKLRFSILKTSLIALRGFRGHSTTIDNKIPEDVDIDLIPSGQLHF